MGTSSSVVACEAVGVRRDGREGKHLIADEFIMVLPTTACPSPHCKKTHVACQVSFINNNTCIIILIEHGGREAAVAEEPKP